MAAHEAVALSPAVMKGTGGFMLLAGMVVLALAVFSAMFAFNELCDRV